MERIYIICILMTVVCEARDCPDLKQSGDCANDIYTYLMELTLINPKAVDIVDNCKHLECISTKVRNCENFNKQRPLYESYLKAGEYLCGEAREVWEANAECLSSSNTLMAHEKCRNQVPGLMLDEDDHCSQIVHATKCMATVGTKQCGINAGNMINKTVEIFLYPTLDYLQCVYIGTDGQCHYPGKSNDCSIDIVIAMWMKGFIYIPNPPVLMKNCNYFRCFQNAVENCPHLIPRKTVISNLEAGHILCNTAYDVLLREPGCLSTAMEKDITECDGKEGSQQDTKCGYVQVSSNCTIKASKQYCSIEASAKIIEAVNVVKNATLDDMKCF